ncbi:MAG: 1-aminocyclopropane-1-carboxylate deaminase/D-cysteine desulfhydrase [Flavobacteriales bacterium]
MIPTGHLLLPSPVERIEHPLLKSKSIELFIKRDDLMHTEISGNKYRKLHYNLAQAELLKKETILTFGGAFSNHIAATASACALAGIKSIGIIRGEEADLENPTLKRAHENGMIIHPITRERYDQKEEPLFHEELRELFGNIYIIPEGGKNYYGVNGCIEILQEVKEEFDLVCCAVGTGTTLSGLSIGLNEQQRIIGFPAIKSGEYLLEEVKSLLHWSLFDEEWVESIVKKISLQCDFHFGGFAKSNPKLLQFISDFESITGIPLDKVYTGKMMFGLMEMIRNGSITGGTRILIYHSGGLQGN